VNNADATTPAPEGSLRSALSLSNNYSADPMPDRRVVYFADDIEGGNTIIPAATISIRGDMMLIGRLGDDGRPDITIDGSGNKRVINHTVATAGECFYLFGLNIKNGYYTLTQSGGVNSLSGSAYIQQCVFTGNLGSIGGALYAGKSTTLISCIFKDNTSTGSGGAVNVGTGDLLIENCAFINNKSNSGDGGAVNALPNQALNTIYVVSDCVFAGNSATGSFGGGGAFLGGKSVTISGCIFANNTASSIIPGYQGGGGLYTSYATVTACTFIGNNSLKSSGGGVYAANDSTFVGCTFIGNTAVNGGGGLFAISDAALDGCVFYENEAATAGALHGNHLLMTNCTVTGNVTHNASSGAVESSYRSYIFHVTVTDNIGGGICGLNPGYSVSIYNCIVTENIDTGGSPMQVVGSMINVSSLIEGQDGITHELVFGDNAFDILTGTYRVLEDGIAAYTATAITDAEIDSISDLSTTSLFQKFDVKSALKNDQTGALRSDTEPTYGAVEAGITAEIEPIDTTTAVVSDNNPSMLGEQVVFTATVAAASPDAGTPTGTVSFYNDGIWIGDAVLDASGKAVLSTSELALGMHQITAEYLGDEGFDPSFSPMLEQVVIQDTVPPISPTPGTTYYITATASQGAAISPEGTVAVNEGGSKTFFFTASYAEVDGVPLSPADIEKGYFTFTDVKMNHAISVKGTVQKDVFILSIDVVEGSGRAEYSLNGSPFVEYAGPALMQEGSSLIVKAYAGEGYEFREWRMGEASFSDQQISFDPVEASIHLDLYFAEKSALAGLDGNGNLWSWLIVLVLLLLLAGLLWWFIVFYRRYYDVIKPDDTTAKVIGDDKVHRKSRYAFRIDGGYAGTVVYRIGYDEDDPWKTILPDPDGEYTIPKGEAVDDIIIELR